jgi:hypothetical protein
MHMKKLTLLVLTLLLGSAALAKLPSLSEEARAKVAEAAAKTVWAGKVDAYQLCQSQDRTAAHYAKVAKAAGKEPKPAAATPPCVDPGPFVYPPAVAVAAAAPSVASGPALPAALAKKP